jgi:uncharacterized protein (TIGR03435 family)
MAVVAFGQPRDAFEVTSIKPADPAARGVRLQITPGGGLRADNINLRALMEFAFDVQNFQIAGGPAWIDSQRFDILAKPPEGGPAKEDAELSRSRLQALLADRFQLKFHRDSKDAPVYALVAAKNGPKLKESTGESRGLTGNAGSLIGEGASVQLLAGLLSRRTGRVVVDNTGLTGRYDFKLEWSPELGEPTGKGRPEGPALSAEQPTASDLLGPSLFSALQEQLGLKLESQKAPVETIVIDRVEKPAAN